MLKDLESNPSNPNQRRGSIPRQLTIMKTETMTQIQTADISADLVRVHWVDLKTSDCGCGDPVPRNVAEAVLSDVVPRYPEIQHWIAEP